MLVGYSSSSEEDVEEGLPATKKAKTERDVTNSRLPLPGCLLSMFPDDEDAHTEDSTLHSGRIRSFKHERGNWATYVYLPYHAEEEFAERLEELLSAAAAHGVEMKQQQEFHLSLSQTVVLKHHWIQPFTQSLRKSLSRWERFVCTAGRLKVYCNEERTRTFLGMESSTGHTELLDLVQVVDRTMTEFCLQTFYENPSFHISLAWCVGDKSVQMKECLRKLQTTHILSTCDYKGSVNGIHPQLDEQTWKDRYKESVTSDSQRRGYTMILLRTDWSGGGTLVLAQILARTKPGPDQSLSDEHEEGAFLLRLDCEEVRCRTGNKTFRFPLECRHAT